MPIPFPGMDPWLERPDLWRGVHTQLIVDVARALNPLLRPRYRVAIEERTYLALVHPDDLDPDKLNPDKLVSVPDVMVLDERDGSPRAAVMTTGTVTNGTGPIMAELPIAREEVRERYLEVVSTSSGEVITAIEILSPSNKIGREGRSAYEKKRDEVLKSRTNLVELDLLRTGRSMNMTLSTSQAADYRIVVSRAWQRPYADVYLCTVRQPVPSFPVPLREGEEEPVVDINRLLHELYDLLSYDMAIDYTHKPVPNLSDDDATWADVRLRAQGLIA